MAFEIRANLRGFSQAKAEADALRASLRQLNDSSFGAKFQPGAAGRGFSVLGVPGEPEMNQAGNRMMNFRMKMRTEGMLLGAAGIESPVEKYMHTFEYLEFMAQRMGDKSGGIGGLLLKVLPGAAVAGGIGLIAMQLKELGEKGKKAFEEVGLGSQGFLRNIQAALDPTIALRERVEDTGKVAARYGAHYERLRTGYENDIAGSGAPMSTRLQIELKENRAKLEREIKAAEEQAAAEKKQRGEAGGMDYATLSAVSGRGALGVMGQLLHAGNKWGSLLSGNTAGYLAAEADEQGMRDAIQKNDKVAIEALNERIKKRYEDAAKKEKELLENEVIAKADESDVADRDADYERRRLLQQKITLGKRSGKHDRVSEYMIRHGIDLFDEYGRADAERAVNGEFGIMATVGKDYSKMMSVRGGWVEAAQQDRGRLADMADAFSATGYNQRYEAQANDEDRQIALQQLTTMGDIRGVLERMETNAIQGSVSGF